MYAQLWEPIVAKSCLHFKSGSNSWTIHKWWIFRITLITLYCKRKLAYNTFLILFQMNFLDEKFPLPDEATFNKEKKKVSVGLKNA